MAGARQHTALPPRSRPGRPRSPGRRRPAPPPLARGRGGTRGSPPPPPGSRAKTRRFREQFGGDSYPFPPSHPLAVGLPPPPTSSGLRLHRRACTPAWGSGDHRSHLPASPSSPLSLPEGRPEPFSVAGCALCACRAAAAAGPPRPGVGFASVILSSLCPINYRRLFEGLESACPLPLIFSIPR